MSIRWAIWLVVNVALLAVCITYGLVTTSFDAAGIERVLLGVSMGGLGLASVILFPGGSQKKVIGLIILVSLLPRLALLPTAPSDDVNRYLWEGKLTALGVNPYQAVADDPVFEDYRDEYWALMNHRDRPTAYPPLAMQAFRLINMLGYNPMSYKVVGLLLDMLLIATLLALLKHHGLPLRWVLFYALSPLSLLSYAAEGHFDILMILALVVALLAYSKRWLGICGAAMAVAVGVKIMAAVAAPILLWRSGVKGWVVAAITLLLPLAFYWQSLGSVIHAVFLFGSGGRFNSPNHQILSWLFDYNLQWANLGVAALYAVCWLFAFWLMLKRQLWSAILMAMGALVILSPIVHFWYLSWALPMIALRPKLSWVSLSITSSLYFLVWHFNATGQGWMIPMWGIWLFWTPFFLILIVENKSLFRKLKMLMRKKEAVQNTDFSIVIPTYNPGGNLQTSLSSVIAQTLRPREIVIADASSTDGSLENLEVDGLPLSVVTTGLGRGEQIKAGIEKANGDWVIVLHSDVILPVDAFGKLSEALDKNPRVLGGALGQRFSNQSLGLLLIESMNEFRGILMNTSFGDQTQFFHRKTATEEGVLTSQPLMEDVEMSDRLSTLGDVLYLGVEGKVSAQKWVSNSFWKRFRTIVRFFFQYRVLAFGNADKRAAFSEKLYKEYYK